MPIIPLRPLPTHLLVLLEAPQQIRALRSRLAPGGHWHCIEAGEELDSLDIPHSTRILAVGCLGAPCTQAWLRGPALDLRRQGCTVVVVLLNPLDADSIGWKDQLRWNGAACFEVLPEPPECKPGIRLGSRGTEGLLEFARFWMHALEQWSPFHLAQFQAVLDQGYGCRTFLGDPGGDADAALRTTGAHRRGEWDPEHLWALYRAPEGGVPAEKLWEGVTALEAAFPETKDIQVFDLPVHGELQVRTMVVAWP